MISIVATKFRCSRKSVTWFLLFYISSNEYYNPTVMIAKPFWYHLIEVFRSKDLILDGLTIPFILGAQQYIDKNAELDYNAVAGLFTAVAGADLPEKAVLKDCAANQYIITLRTNEFCRENLQHALIFKNAKGRASLYVAEYLMWLGKNIDEISKALFNEYKGLFQRKTFSWHDRKLSWQELSADEILVIREAANLHA